jgi:hypothetical protein
MPIISEQCCKTVCSVSTIGVLMQKEKIVLMITKTLGTEKNLFIFPSFFLVAYFIIILLSCIMRQILLRLITLLGEKIVKSIENYFLPILALYFSTYWEGDFL